MEITKEQLIDNWEYEITDQLGYEFLENLQALSNGNNQFYFMMLRGSFYTLMEKKSKNK
jgi:hypothetical protein